MLLVGDVLDALKSSGEEVQQRGALLGVKSANGATTLTVGPINLMLTAPVFGSAWLLAGTVDEATMTAAAASNLPVAGGFR